MKTRRKKKNKQHKYQGQHELQTMSANGREYSATCKKKDYEQRESRGEIRVSTEPPKNQGISVVCGKQAITTPAPPPSRKQPLLRASPSPSPFPHDDHRHGAGWRLMSGGRPALEVPPCEPVNRGFIPTSGVAVTSCKVCWPPRNPTNLVNLKTNVTEGEYL